MCSCLSVYIDVKAPEPQHVVPTVEANVVSGPAVIIVVSRMSDLPLDLSFSSDMAAKRGLTLDLKNGPAKRTRLSVTGPAMGQGGNPPPILTTPDVQMLKMSSPEMAKFLNANNSLATPTPSGIIFPKTVTEEQVRHHH